MRRTSCCFYLFVEMMGGLVRVIRSWPTACAYVQNYPLQLLSHVYVILQHHWSLLCSLAPALVLVISCCPSTDKSWVRECRCLNAASLAFYFSVAHKDMNWTST